MITNDNYLIEYLGNGTAKSYNTDFKVYSEEEVIVSVYLNGADGTKPMHEVHGQQNPEEGYNVLTLNSHYTVSGVNNDTRATITLLAPSAGDNPFPWLDADGDLKGHVSDMNDPSSYKIRIENNPSFTQNLSLGNQQVLNRRQLENALDKQISLLQEKFRNGLKWKGVWNATTEYEPGDVVFYDDGTEKDHYIAAVTNTNNIPDAENYEPGTIGNVWDSLTNRLLGGPFLSKKGGTVGEYLEVSYTSDPSQWPNDAAVPKSWITQHVAQGAFNESDVEDFALVANTTAKVGEDRIDEATTKVFDWARDINNPKIPFKVLNEATSKIGDWARVHDPGSTDPDEPPVRPCLLYTSPSPRD